MSSVVCINLESLSALSEQFACSLRRNQGCRTHQEQTGEHREHGLSVLILILILDAEAELGRTLARVKSQEFGGRAMNGGIGGGGGGCIENDYG